MDIPVSVSTAQLPDPSATVPAGQQRATTNDGNGGRDFADVLHNTAAKSQTDKGNPDVPAEAPKAQEELQTDAVSPLRGEAGPPATPASEAQDADATLLDAASVAPGTGNEVPAFTAMLWVPVPAINTAVAVPDVTASTEIGASAGQEVTAAETVSPVLAGAAAFTVESRAARAATRGVAGVRPAAQTTAAAPGRDVPVSVNLQADASAFEPDLATLASNNAPAGSERSTLTMSRLESALTMAQPLTPMQPSAPSSGAPTPTAAHATVALPLHHPQWQDAFAARVAWQVRDGLQQVSLAINPPELGPVEVRMSINDDRVSAQFITPHHVVRQVIEDAMPRLRDMLSQSGLNLADANVFQHAPGRDGQAQSFAGRSGDPSAVNGPSIADDASPRAVRVAHVGLIDAYV